MVRALGAEAPAAGNASTRPCDRRAALALRPEALPPPGRAAPAFFFGRPDEVDLLRPAAALFFRLVGGNASIFGARWERV